MKGCINSINPMAMDCGPGIRVLVDIEQKEDGIELTPNEMVDRIRKFRPYFGPDNGGVTFTGKDLNKYIGQFSKSFRSDNFYFIDAKIYFGGKNNMKKYLKII